VTTRSLWYERFGDPRQVLILKESPLGDLGNGAAVVKMRLCPINPSDLIPITGAYAHRVVPPLIAGYEGMGTVESVSEAASVAPGDRVLVSKHIGTWSERIVVGYRKLIPIPDAVSDLEAARGYINPMTCLLMLKKFPIAGQRILLTGGGSTCALLLCQWARLQGALGVTVVVRSPDARTLHESIAGVQVIGIDEEPELRTAARVADITFDSVGGTLGDTILAWQRSGARFVSYGLLSGTPLDDCRFGSRIDRFYLRLAQDGCTDEEWLALFEEIWRLLSVTRIPEIEIFPFENIQDALDYFYSGHRERKPVLQFAPAL
jgi:NADPH:quinone reductase-like Zn-dependent oxidoreductase